MNDACVKSVYVTLICIRNLWETDKIIDKNQRENGIK